MIQNIIKDRKNITVVVQAVAREVAIDQVVVEVAKVKENLTNL